MSKNIPSGSVGFIFTSDELAAIGELAALHSMLSESTKPEVRAVSRLIVMRVGELCGGASLHRIRPEEILEFARSQQQSGRGKPRAAHLAGGDRTIPARRKAVALPKKKTGNLYTRKT